MAAAKRKGPRRLHAPAPRPSDPHFPTHAGAKVTPTGEGSRVTVSVPCNPQLPQLGVRHEFECPVCGRADANYTWKLDQYGRLRPFVGCWSDGCQGGGYLGELAELIGAPHGAALLDDPERWLGDLAVRRRTPGPPPPLPSPKWVRRWGVNARSSPAAQRELLGVRQLSPAVERDTRIGWDGARLIVPMFLGGQLVAYKWGRPGRRPSLMKPADSGGWAWPLYPEPQRKRRWTWLVEGEFDALRLRSAGLPATSVTGGKDQWRPEWVEQLRGLRVHVMFDVGAEAEALERVRTLRAAGVWAKHEPARLLGLTEHNADVSDYLNEGGDVDALRRRARRTA